MLVNTISCLLSLRIRYGVLSVDGIKFKPEELPLVGEAPTRQ